MVTEPNPAAEEHTPASIAAELAPHWSCEITNVEIAQDMLGWAVRVTVSPGGRRRSIVFSESGETREGAVTEILESGAFAWPSIHELLVK